MISIDSLLKDCQTELANCRNLVRDSIEAGSQQDAQVILLDRRVKVALGWIDKVLRMNKDDEPTKAAKQVAHHIKTLLTNDS